MVTGGKRFKCVYCVCAIITLVLCALGVIMIGVGIKTTTNMENDLLGLMMFESDNMADSCYTSELLACDISNDAFVDDEFKFDNKNISCGFKKETGGSMLAFGVFGVLVELIAMFIWCACSKKMC